MTNCIWYKRDGNFVFLDIQEQFWWQFFWVNKQNKNLIRKSSFFLLSKNLDFCFWTLLIIKSYIYSIQYLEIFFVESHFLFLQLVLMIFGSNLWNLVGICERAEWCLIIAGYQNKDCLKFWQRLKIWVLWFMKLKNCLT